MFRLASRRIGLNTIGKRCRFNLTSTKAGTRSSVSPALAFAAGAGIVAAAAYFATPSKSVAPVDTRSTLPLDLCPSPVYATKAEVDQAIEEIKNMFIHDTPIKVIDMLLVVNDTQEELDSHSDTYFNSHHAAPDERPYYVVYPRLTEETLAVMKICHKYKVPVVPTSGRLSLEGHFIPTRGGISLDLSTMDEVIQLNKTDLDVTVQAGMGWETLADYLEEYNLFYSIDPGPGATVLGCLANNASGTNALRYGEAYKNVINLTVVLADGTVVKTKQRPRKLSAGYNLNNLFVGSEGTLGIITEATVKLHVKPAIELVVVVPFPLIKDCANAVNEIVLSGIQLNAIEMLDDKMMHVINALGETLRKWAEHPTLFLKIGGPNHPAVDAITDQVQQITKNNHSFDFEYAKLAQEKTELWLARKVALWSTINQGKEIDPDMQLWTTDAAVPISKLPEFLTETKADIDAHGLSNTLVAHIGDGNAHSFIIFTPDQREVAEKVVNRMVKRAIDMEGTCTGEHGVGFGKRDYLLEEVGENLVDVMRKVKFALDPLRILNPDKVFKSDPNERPQYHGGLVDTTKRA
ncbi:FAD-binding protein [Kocuria palustris]|nr:FAD-binding protein [Kocuria palustris]